MKKEIQVVSFDVDGTLVDQEFNDLIWKHEIPASVCQHRGWTLDKAKEFCISEYQKVGEHDLRWYDIEYWLERFKIKTPALDILRKWEESIVVYPDVLPTLDKLRGEGIKTIIITCMPRIFLREKIRTFDTYFEEIFSTISDFQKVKSPAIYMSISEKIHCEPSAILHVGDHPLLDYQFSSEAGCQSLLIEREGTTIKHSIQQLEEIFKIISANAKSPSAMT